MKRILLAFSIALGAGAALPALSPAMAQTTNPPAASSAPALDASLNSVARAQTRLRQLGFYDGAVSGVRTIATERAIRRFQRSRGLHATGELDQRTREALQI